MARIFFGKTLLSLSIAAVVSACSPQPAATAPTAAPVQATAPNFGVPNVKVNPAHGQPGHDCAIAVGAPLPVK